MKRFFRLSPPAFWHQNSDPDGMEKSALEASNVDSIQDGPPQCDDPVHTTHCSNDYMAAALLLWRWVGRTNIELQAGTFGVWNTFSCRNIKPTPSNLIGSMMIMRVLPIHVPPCYEGGYLKPTPLKPYMTYDDHLVWPIHVPRRCEPLTTPHGEGGKGVKMGTLHWGGCLPNLDHISLT